MFRRRSIAAALLLAACAAPPEAPTPAPVGASIGERHASLSAEVARTSTEALCKRHEGGADPLLIQMIEAELAVRAAAACAAPRFVAPAPKATYPRTQSAGQACAAFPSAAEAQRAFLAAGGPAFDPQALDPDGDGAACGWSAARTQIAAAAEPAPGPVGVYQRGPRGGCYTFTSSGRKRYVPRNRC